MCGIAGFTTPRGLAAEQRTARFGERLRRMTASLRHRGPDAQRGVLLDGAALGLFSSGCSEPAEDPVSPTRSVADRVVFMDEGRIVEQNPPREFFANPRNERTRDFLAKVLPR